MILNTGKFLREKLPRVLQFDSHLWMFFSTKFRHTPPTYTNESAFRESSFPHVFLAILYMYVYHRMPWLPPPLCMPALGKTGKGFISWIVTLPCDDHYRLSNATWVRDIYTFSCMHVHVPHNMYYTSLPHTTIHAVSAQPLAMCQWAVPLSQWHSPHWKAVTRLKHSLYY